eukprot:Platyproteum_vivax@DN2354_c0_g1_i1.p1
MSSIRGNGAASSEAFSNFHFNGSPENTWTQPHQFSYSDNTVSNSFVGGYADNSTFSPEGGAASGPMPYDNEFQSFVNYESSSATEWTKQQIRDLHHQRDGDLIVRGGQKILLIGCIDIEGKIGINSDIEVVTSLECQPICVVVGVISSKTLVQASPVVNTEVIRAMLQNVWTKHRDLRAIKVGLIFNSEIMCLVEELLQAYYGYVPIVVDPSLIHATKFGKVTMLHNDLFLGICHLCIRIFRYASVLTLTLAEAEAMIQVYYAQEDHLQYIESSSFLRNSKDAAEIGRDLHQLLGIEGVFIPDVSLPQRTPEQKAKESPYINELLALKNVLNIQTVDEQSEAELVPIHIYEKSPVVQLPNQADVKDQSFKESVDATTISGIRDTKLYDVLCLKSHSRPLLIQSKSSKYNINSNKLACGITVALAKSYSVEISCRTARKFITF